mgnify:CR=1 FL=1
MRILIAEDEKDLNHILVQKLTQDGYSVDNCYDGQEAMDILTYTKYDAVILDIMMPKADGFTVLSFIRQRNDDTPVLFLTAKDSVSDRVKGLDSGANDYLIKPFSLEELYAAHFAWSDLKYSFCWRSDFGLLYTPCCPCGQRDHSFFKRICIAGIPYAQSRTDSFPGKN